jgi:Rad3-related DNA helicase
MFVSARKNHNYQSPTMIIDEGHNAIPFISDMSAERLWKAKWDYPRTIRTEADILDWLEQQRLTGRKKLSEVIKSMRSDNPSYVFERTTEPYRGVEQELIKARPVTVRNYKPILWPWFVRKVVILSATFNYKDIEELGLDRRRVKYIRTQSPIPPSSRPVVYSPIGSMAIKDQDKTLPKAAARLRGMLDQYLSKGVIHCTYGVAAKLREHLDHPRLIWHDRSNKRDQYQKFLDDTEGGVLVACGLAEGIDLPKDLGRWQVILKIPFPSLADTAISIKMREDIEWYHWETTRAILQASGRICRTPTDFGLTVILDSAFYQMYQKHPYLFPQWFSEGLVFA